MTTELGKSPPIEKDSFRHKTQEFFVPVHGFVQLFPEEIAIINHPAYQRLRRMRQLGFAHLVFLGANHSRFEHSVGALHVVAKIIEHVERNHKQDELSCGGNSDTFSRSITLDEAQQRFVRLAALCHDLGHLPFSHTLEDELNHLEKHDGADRLYHIANVKWGAYRLPPTLVEHFGVDLKDSELQTVINQLYEHWLTLLFKGSSPTAGEKPIRAFDLFCAVVVKEEDLTKKGSQEDQALWKDRLCELGKVMPVNACRDMVGDTICADFLDYIHRDWYHVGKPLQIDERIYHYMRILRPAGDVAKSMGNDSYRFVIDVGPKMRVRHDALTLVLDLLESRYKLTETVLFHRTKLGVIALLDRILLELRDLWRAAEIGGAKGPETEFQRKLTELLEEHCDDRLGVVLDDLRKGTHEFKALINKVVAHGIVPAAVKEWDETKTQEEFPLPSAPVVVDLTLQKSKKEVKRLFDEIEDMIFRLENRDIYTLAEKIDVETIGGAPTEGNHYVEEVIELYRVPEKRHVLLRAIEARCGLPRASVVMYCPPAKKMGAKIAKVNLHLDGRIQHFDQYEKEAGATGLTCNALGAQVRRFYQLWAVYFFVDRHVWAGMADETKAMFRVLVRVLFIPMKNKQEAKAKCTEAAALFSALRLAGTYAARGGADPGLEAGVTGPVWKLPIGLELPTDGD